MASLVSVRIILSKIPSSRILKGLLKCSWICNLSSTTPTSFTKLVETNHEKYKSELETKNLAVPVLGIFFL